MSLSDFQHNYDVRARRQLESEGYSFVIDANGYSVSFGEQVIASAGVKLSREKPLHWRHAVANRRDNLHVAIIIANRHKLNHIKAFA